MSFWSDTRQKVIAHQRRRAQTWFIRHPLTFGATLGAKGLAWDLPKWGVQRMAGIKTKTKQSKKVDGRSVTVVEHVDSAGNISESRVTRTVESVPRASAIADGPASRPAPHKVTVAPMSPQERTAMVASSKQLLMKTPMGKAFVALAAELDGFAPVRGAEAVSTTQMTQQLSQGLTRVSMGAEAFADVVTGCGMHRSITARLNAAAEAVDIAAKTAARLHKRAEALYDGQITQDMSTATTISAIPVRPGTGDDAEGILPGCHALANYFGMFEPQIDAEATQTLAHLRVAQAGFALLSDMLAAMPKRLRDHGVDKQVTRSISQVSGGLLDSAQAYHYTIREMKRLYQGQMDHEASGVSTIRTAPLRTAA